jgi:hypothetical protein
MRRLWSILGFVLLLMAALLLAVSQLMPMADAAHWDHAVETTGQIVGFSTYGTALRPLVSFVTTDGEPYLFEADAYNSGMIRGQMVTVRYYLEPQLQVSLKTDFTPTQLGLGIAGCTLMALCLVSFILQMRQSSLRRQLMQYGKRYEATITGIETICRVKLSRRSPVVANCTIRDPLGIGERTFRSGWILKPSPALQAGSMVPVLMNPYHPGQYLVLAEEAETQCETKNSC